VARRLVSTVVRAKGGPTLGGSPTRLTVYDDEALTIVSTLYRRATGAGQQPNPITPNAGKQTSLRTAAAAGDTILNVVTIATFAVGDMVPIFDGVNTSFRIITALNASGPTMTVDQTVGFAFTVAATLINRPSMRGHVWFWVDDVRDYFPQPKDVASGELMPPLQLPTQAPVSPINVQEEGVLVNNRGTVNYIGGSVTATDDVPNSRVNVTISAPTQASFDDHSARHEAGGADVLAIDAAAATGSLRTLGYGATKALSGAGLTTAEADLAADVSVAAADTWYDGPSVSLVAGTWFIVAHLQMVTADTNGGGLQAKLWNGTTVEASGEIGRGQAIAALDVTLVGVVVLTATETWKISGAARYVNASKLAAAMGWNGAGNNASSIRAVRIA